MLRFLTAGESHGPELVAVVEGYPAGFDIDLAKINYDLARRQKGYGRGGRMAIERDEVRVVSGIRFGRSMGSPITLIVENRDFKNWQKRMSVDPADRDEAEPVTRPRPGHADLAGVLKYNLDDIRDVLERASARETTMRVAAGSLAKLILEPFGVSTLGYVASIGATEARTPSDLSIEELKRITEASPVRVADLEAERAIIAEIDECKKAGDTLGGVVEVIATGLPVGLGSHVQWDRKLDGRLAHVLLSLQAVKGVELGLGFRAAGTRGSALHDEIAYDPTDRRFIRHSNNSGGTEGGMTHRRATARARSLQATVDADAPVALGGHPDQGRVGRQYRALRRMCNSSRRGNSRGGGRVRTGQRVPGKIRRRFARRNRAQL